MKTVCAKDMCAGCMACINMCKKSAITIVDDYKTYNAVIDEVKCVNCGLCEKICPNVKCVEQVNPIFWKEGWALNPEIRSNASSGGIATVYKGNIIKNLIMDCQSYTKYRPNETTGGIFVSWRRKEELPTGA